MPDVNLPLTLLAAFVSTASPGPATTAILGVSAAQGRRFGVALAFGVLTGSLTWSCLAALGFGAIMHNSAWTFEALRYFGAAYLLWLAFKAARTAWRGAPADIVAGRVPTLRSAYLKGLALHLTNPKAILFFGALFSVGLPAGASPAALALVVGAVGMQSATIFIGYALLFSSAPIARSYARMRRGFEAAFALIFGTLALRMLSARL